MKLTRKNFLRLAVGGAIAACSGALTRTVRGQGLVGTQPQTDDGVRFGMVIDLQKCRREAGCSLCRQACHQAHNVPEIPDPQHAVKWIWNEPAAKVFPAAGESFSARTLPEQLPILCNHCQHPACVRVCPTQATWKRGDGVVMMDYHRCIGCRYCMAACPYGSRSFNFEDPRPYLLKPNPDFPTRTIGVVEKCNFCEERLAAGKGPACAAACPQGALVFGDLSDSASAPRQLLEGRFAIQRRPELGCGPSIFYLV